MLYRIYIILGVIVAALVIWVWLTAAEIVRLEREVEAKFNEVTNYYALMNKRDIVPLISAPGIPEAEKSSLIEISRSLGDFEKTAAIGSRYAQLLEIQQRFFSFFTTPGLSEAMLADANYANWNKNSTNQGEASNLILQYNQALSRYNYKLSTPIGKVVGKWPKWSYREYLSIDGKTQTSTLVQF